MLLFVLLSCYGDVSIMKRIEDTSKKTTVDSADTQRQPSQEPDPEPTSEPDPQPATEPSTEHQERSGISGYTYLGLRQVACPACMGETQEISISFTAMFHQPSSDGHADWIPQNGQCTTNLISVSPSTIPISVGNSINVQSNGHSFAANPITVGTYENNAIWEPQLQRDTQYDVQTDQGSYSFISSHGFDFIEPYTMLWVDPSYAFEAPIYRSGATFNWGPTSADSTFMITVAVYSWDGSQFLGYVTCSGPDNGYMMIPAQYLQPFQAGSLAAIHLERHKVALVETDINNSFIETHMKWEVVGTGIIQ